jgi:hypothetical protein
MKAMGFAASREDCWRNIAITLIDLDSNRQNMLKSIRCAFAGITKDGGSYINMQHDQEDVAEVRSFAKALAMAGAPQKDTLYFARLSRSETAKRAATAPTESQI